MRWIIGGFLLLAASMPHVSPIFWEPESDRRLHARTAIGVALIIALAVFTFPHPRRIDVRVLLGAAATAVHLTI